MSYVELAISVDNLGPTDVDSFAAKAPDPYVSVKWKDKPALDPVCTKVISNCSSPTFEPLELWWPLEGSSKLAFTVCDHNDSSADTPIGEYTCTLDQIRQGDVVNKPLHPSREHSDPIPTITICELMEWQQTSDITCPCWQTSSSQKGTWTFIDCRSRFAFDSGIDFTVGIDFSASTRRLHDSSEGKSQYIKALEVVGKACKETGLDSHISAFGFGAKIDTCITVSYKFPLISDHGYSSCDGIERVKRDYQTTLGKVQLYEPSYFVPIISHVAGKALMSLGTQPQKYFVLLILTDGRIDDLAATKQAIKDASCLPIYIIIVGVGNGDFSQMKQLDRGLKCLDCGLDSVRDIVHFVSIKELLNASTEKLKGAVLAKLPVQIVEYVRQFGFALKSRI